jgi:hypothetical protein
MPAGTADRAIFCARHELIVRFNRPINVEMSVARVGFARVPLRGDGRLMYEALRETPHA